MTGLRAEGASYNEDRPATRRPSRGRKRPSGLTGLQVVLISLSVIAVVLLADWFWSLVSEPLNDTEIAKPIVHLLGEFTFLLLYTLGFAGSIVYFAGRRKGVWNKVGLKWPKRRALMIGIVGGLAAYTLVGLVDGVVSVVLGRDLVDNTRVFAVDYEPTWYSATISFLTAAAIFPFLEELYFRGVLVRWLGDRAPAILANVIGAAVFSAYHENWDYAPSLFLLGLIVGWIYLKTKSLWPAVLAHGVYNAVIDVSGYLTPG